MQRSTQDQNRPRLLARLIPPGSRHRSMSALTTRPVRHSAPLPLSIVAGPHEAGPIRSWRADSLAFVWLDPGITPCCKSLAKVGCDGDSVSLARFATGADNDGKAQSGPEAVILRVLPR